MKDIFLITGFVYRKARFSLDVTQERGFKIRGSNSGFVSLRL